MVAPDPLACESYFQTHTAEEIRSLIRDVLDAMAAPETMTGDSMDGSSKQWQGKSRAELQQALADLNCALKKHEPPETPEVPEVVSRFFDHSKRSALR